MALMITGLMATVGVYPTGLGASPLGGISQVTVSGPNAPAVSLAWSFTGGQITGVDVTWTPTAATTYTINVTAGGATGALTTPTTRAGSQRTDAVPLPAVQAGDMTTIRVAIVESQAQEPVAARTYDE